MTDQHNLVHRGTGGSAAAANNAAAPSSSSSLNNKGSKMIQIEETTRAHIAADLASGGDGGGGGGGGNPLIHDEEQAEMRAHAAGALDIDQRYAQERHAAKVRHWREGDLAAGLVELTWRDERARHPSRSESEANGPNRGCCADCCQEEMEPTCGCLYVSGVVCARFGRVGNMVILSESTVVVEEDVPARDDLDGGDDAEEQMESEHGLLASSSSASSTKRRVSIRKINLVVGPYWPMLLGVTYPLIFGVSFWTFVSAILPGKRHPLIVFIWFALTLSLIYALFSVGFRDPGILKRHRTPPPGTGKGEWRWNDQAQTYRPRGAIYDPDCAVVIEDFDHTCPWTGTGIGRKNMPAFQAFVALVFICLIMDILLLTSAF